MGNRATARWDTPKGGRVESMDLYTCPTCGQQRDIYWISIKELWLEAEVDFNVRAYNCMRGARVETIGDLLSYTAKDMLRWKNSGPKTVKHITDLVLALGLSLPTENTPNLEARRTRYYEIHPS